MSLAGSGPPAGRERRQGGRARRQRAGSLGPGMRRALLPGGCNTRGEGRTRRRGGGAPPSHLPRRPSQPSRSRSRRTAAVEMRPAAPGRRPGGGPWRGLLCLSPGDLPNPGIKPMSYVSCIGKRVLYHKHHLASPQCSFILHQNQY